ncbi:MAG: DUF1800 family protein [Candidatus Hydrogenedentes bacterium]|nr:DUF1800 family protein [Candidatus Hydrogenedentota bacterium]
MIVPPHPLLETMTLFWHSHFGISNAQVKNARLMQQHVQLLRKEALGSFGTMLRAIPFDPAVLLCLDSTANRKAMPNENFARALLENYTLGPGHFKEEDVAEAARAFTGWFVLRGKLKYIAREHDEGPKSILGRQANFAAADVVEIVLNQRVTSERIVRKLYRWLISETQEPADELIRPLAEALAERCAPYVNVELVHGDVMLFQPEDQYDVVFLGGMLMYLNEQDVISLLQRLSPFLQPEGFILCRETTVRQGTTMCQGDYQAVYRSVADYERIFAECDLSILKLEVNEPYVLMQMGCEFVKKWKALTRTSLQCLPAVGRLAYWGLRLGYPWITRVPTALRLAYPELTNHFFVLQPGSQPTSNRAAHDHAA